MAALLLHACPAPCRPCHPSLALTGSASPAPSTGSASPEPGRQVATGDTSLCGRGAWLCSRAAAGDAWRPGDQTAAVPTITMSLHFLSLDSTSPPEKPPDLCFLTAPRTRNPTLPAPTVSWAATQTAGGSDSATSSEQRPGDRVPPSNASGTGVGKDLKVTVPQPHGSLLQRETRKERRVLPERPGLFPTAMLRHSFRLTCRGHSSGALEPPRGVTTHDQCRSLSSVQMEASPRPPLPDTQTPATLAPGPWPPEPLAPGPGSHQPPWSLRWCPLWTPSGEEP